MKNHELENHMKFLLSAALQKCGDIYDAEDLTQETLLAALSYISGGKVIDDMRAWLLVVMNRKYNDMLRQKYRKTTVSIRDDFDIIDEYASVSESEDDEAENVRRAVAHLAKIYREVIVRYYMNGQSVSEIAAELDIPEGTVKSRLRLGREHVKKGIINMEKYSNQSYAPIRLYVTNSGNWGRNFEPMSLVNSDLLAQNILWRAYTKPASIEELSYAIGVPAAYVEPVVQKLVTGELMKRLGSKYYTDFMITTVEDEEKYIPEQKEFVSENFDCIWNPIERGLEKLRGKDYYKRSSFDAQRSFELYFVFNCLDYGLFMTQAKILKTETIFPDRADGGRWIAFGHVHFKKYDPMEHYDLASCDYSGERWARVQNFAGSKMIELHVYGIEGFPAYMYDASPDYTFFKNNEYVDDVFVRLFYLIHSGTDPVSVGFNTEYLRAIPWLKKCRVLKERDGKPTVNIPVISKAESEELWEICDDSKKAMVDDLMGALSEFYVGKRRELPEHLDSVPLQKQYSYTTNAVLFTTIREAIKRGKLYDGNYDDDSSEENQPHSPMVLIVE